MADDPLAAFDGKLRPDKGRVRGLRAARGWKTIRLAKEAGVSQHTIENIENDGHPKPFEADTLRRVAGALGIDLWEIITEEEQKELESLLGLRERRSSRHPALPDPFRPRPLFQLPDTLADFTGREDQIRLMVERLRGGGGTVSVSALRGMGGVGKTSLAIRVAHEVADCFPDARLLLDLDGMSVQPMTTVDAMGWVIRVFHPEVAKLPDTEPDLLPYYLSALRGKRALILLDNAHDAAQVKRLVTAPPPVGFIVTSRVALALDCVESIRLDVLPPEQGLALLRAIVRAKGTDAELRKVAELCGHLPLAVRVAGDLLRLKEDWTFTWFIEALTAERLRWLKIHGDPEKDVEAVLKLSATQLVIDNVELARRWHYLARWPGEFSLDAAGAAWGKEVDEWSVRGDLSALAERSLILFDQKSQRYRLHDLMRPIAEGLFG